MKANLTSAVGEPTMKKFLVMPYWRQWAIVMTMVIITNHTYHPPNLLTTPFKMYSRQ